MDSLSDILKKKLAEGVSPHFITTEAFNTLLEAMKEACRQACEEQKRICIAYAKADWDTHRGSVVARVKDHTILKAPLPEIK